MLPKLWIVLRDGGHGNASIIHPNLLPFVSQINLHVKDGEDFYQKFFDHLRAG